MKELGGLNNVLLKHKIQEEIENNSNNAKKKKDKLSLNQQLLALCYSGQMSNLKELGLPNTKLAQLISVITNGDCNNIRQELSYINPKKVLESRIATTENLKIIKPYFEKAGLSEVVLQIESDLNEIKKK
jgi:hypothetical protein